MHKGRWIAVLVLAGMMLALPVVQAGEKDGGHKHGKAKVQTGSVTGVVVDLACEILGEEPGPGHQTCGQGGVPVGILDGKGRLWICINAEYGSASDLLVPLMGRKVRAEGWFVNKGKYGLLSIAKVSAQD